MRPPGRIIPRIVRQALLIIVCLGVPLCVVYALLHRVVPMMLGAPPDVIDYAATYNLIVACGRPFGMGQMVLSSVFRGAGDVKTPMKINLLANAFNVVGNYLLIHHTHQVSVFGMGFMMPGAGMGVAGAALSTALSMVLGGTLSIYMLLKKPSEIQVSLRDKFRIEWPIMRKIIKISFPAVIERISMQAAGMVITNAIASLGTVALAASNLYVTAESMVFMPAFAVSAAATTLTGQFLGAKKPEKAQSYVYRMCLYSLGIFAAMGALLFVFAKPLIRLFTPDEAVIALAVSCLRIVAVIQPVQALAFIFAGALRGAADTWSTLIIVMIGNWAVRVALTVIAVFVLHYDLVTVAYCMCADIALRCLLYFLRYKSGKWKTLYKL